MIVPCYVYKIHWGGFNNFMEGVEKLSLDGWELVRIIPLAAGANSDWNTSFYLVFRMPHEIWERKNALKVAR